MQIEAIELRVGDVVKFRESNKTHDGYRLENVTGKILTEWRSDFSTYLHFMCENEEDGIFYSSVKPFDSVEIFNRKVTRVQPAKRKLNGSTKETKTRKLLRKKPDSGKPVLRRKEEAPTVERRKLRPKTEVSVLPGGIQPIRRKLLKRRA